MAAGQRQPRGLQPLGWKVPEIPAAGCGPGESVSSSPSHAEPPGVQWARCLSRHPRGEAPSCLCRGLILLSCLEASERPKDHHSLWLVDFSSRFSSLAFFLLWEISWASWALRLGPARLRRRSASSIPENTAAHPASHLHADQRSSEALASRVVLCVEAEPRELAATWHFPATQRERGGRGLCSQGMAEHPSASGQESAGETDPPRGKNGKHRICLRYDLT